MSQSEYRIRARQLRLARLQTLASKGQLKEDEFIRIRKLLGRVARHDDVAAAKVLFRVATLHVEPPGTSTSSTAKVDFYGEIRIHQVRSLARRFIAGMSSNDVEQWLLTVAQSKPGKRPRPAHMEFDSGPRFSDKPARR